ncbi:MAG: FHA domain-containing protein [Acidobacteriota bacterium]
MDNQTSTDAREGACLLGLTGSLAGSRIALVGHRIIIGRDASECNITLEQAVVSRQHAVLEFDAGNTPTILDLGSSHGTFVNGKRITQCKLEDGDSIGLGPQGMVAFTYRAAMPNAGVQPAGKDDAGASRESTATSLRQRLAASAQLATGNLKPAESRGAVIAGSPARELSVLRLGRAPDNEIALEAPGVSRYHASLTYTSSGQPMLADLGSTNGTFVNGEPVTQPRLLTSADLVFLGGFLLRVNGRDVKCHDLSASRISALSITEQIGDKTILKDISLAISPREFVGLMGPSGCGKSTLMDALNGLRPASSGSVYINDLDLYRNFDALRRSIGHVPQRDILHDALSVERTLYYSARLRLPAATPPDQVRHVVDEVIQTIGLQEFRTNQFRQLSGGQQKRLSLGIELITKPSFIFLDEPTSPLDPETTENMMELFRRLADEGRIVVMVTHKFEKFDLMHHVAILTRGGRLAFFGPPREALEYFGCHEPTEIYRRIGGREPDELRQSFEASATRRRYVSERIAEAQEVARTSGQLGVATPDQRGVERRFGLGQWSTLTRRYLEIKLKDTRNTMLLLVQAPVIAVILAVITGNSLNDAKTIFIAAIISIWFGANNAAREIVSETPIYVRERLVNLKIPSYVFSKFAVLSGIALIQCSLFAGILIALGRLSGGDFGWLILILYLTSLSGITMGLFFSALVNSTEKAMSILPLILIPQLLLSGFLKPLDDLYVNPNTRKPATAAEYQRFKDSAKQPVPTPSRTAPGAAPAIIDPVTKSDGLGAARFVADLMIARWSIEALAHAVSIDDQKGRDTLATMMTVAEYDHVFRKDSQTVIESSYRRRVMIDSAALGGFIALFLALTMWALKRKDVL